MSKYARKNQRQASNPDRSVWVSASAGTGKTRVLIDRVLSLLLPKNETCPGAHPDKILCLTYTRAAAQEMTARLLKQVSKWAVCAEAELVNDLTDLLGQSPKGIQIKSARRLFARLVDGPEQVRMMTIHSFCQSVLTRFPLEAGIPLHFKLITETESALLLKQARFSVFRCASSDPVLNGNITKMLSYIDDDSMVQLLSGMFKDHKRELTSSFLKNKNHERRGVLCRQFGLDESCSDTTWQQAVFDFMDQYSAQMKRLIQSMSSAQTTKTDHDQAHILVRWLEQTRNEKIEQFMDLSDFVYDTKQNRRFEKDPIQGIRKKDPDINRLYCDISVRIDGLIRYKKLMDLVELNVALFHVAEEVMKEFDSIKYKNGLLDFDDVIRYTLRLLRPREGKNDADLMSWVMYKLDGGIDHVLVDEAQDTNPEQWAIIEALTASFFDDEGLRTDPSRTVFVVGDQKQSIYSFQGADPDSFEKSIFQISKTRNGSGQSVLDRVPLQTSFRSVRAVLDLVDHVFLPDSLRQHLREDKTITHIVSREGQGGIVELWPLECASVRGEKKEAPTEWLPSTTIRSSDDHHARLAFKIADQIRDWLDRKDILQSHGRPIEPRDIIILFRKRAEIMRAVLSALRARQIPVSGMDRFRLTDDLVISDLLSAAKFVLLPEDDLNLACFLKSPFMGLSEDDLIHLAPNRTGSLWNALQKDEKYVPFVSYLNGLIERQGTENPYQFFSNLLSTICPAEKNKTGWQVLKKRFSDTCIEIIDQFMEMVLTLFTEGQTLLQTVHSIISEEIEIKREGDREQNVVRLMTVHGSKGLESPIVILPDTVGTQYKKQKQSVFWPDETGCDFPIWSPWAESRPDELNQIIERARGAGLSEDRRLLYVALTRAEDRLIIAGACKEAEKIDPESWYATVSAGFDCLKTRPEFHEIETATGLKKIYQTPQISACDRNRKSEENRDKSEQDASCPLWLKLPLAQEKRPLYLQRADAVTGRREPVSPVCAVLDPLRFKRGILTHKLLQVLPDLPCDRWEDVAQSYLRTHGDGITSSDCQEIAREVQRLLTHPEFSFIFGPESRAEVPITGVVEGRGLVSGQIDRLVITKEQIVIVDYKTNRPPPEHIEQVPAGYLEQIFMYRALLKEAYPDRLIRTFLIWTQGPRLMELTERLSIQDGGEYRDKCQIRA